MESGEGGHVRSTFRLHRAIAHWAHEARGMGHHEHQLVSGDNTSSPSTACLRVAERAEEMRARIERDCSWATVGLRAELARHRELTTLLELASAKMEASIRAARAGEAKQCQHEVWRLSVELAKANDELAVRARQLRFVELDRAALVSSRQELGQQVAIAGHKVHGEGKCNDNDRAEQQPFARENIMLSCHQSLDDARSVVMCVLILFITSLSSLGCLPRPTHRASCH